MIDHEIEHFIFYEYVQAFVCFLLISYGIFPMELSNRVHLNMRRHYDIQLL